MPTGYTAGVHDGRVTEFAEFAMGCARAFGACISLRDSDASEPIPQEFEPCTYHADGLMQAKAELAAFNALTDRDVARMAEAEYAEQVEYVAKQQAENTERRARYDAMLSKVAAWQPPTNGHTGLREFMIEQLLESIRFDCSGYEPPAPVLKTEAQWKADKLERIERSIARHTEEHAKEVERARDRTQWVKDLRASLGV